MTTPFDMNDITHENDFFSLVHHQPKKLLTELMDMPAHIHHIAHHMSNPPIERRQSQDEFRYVLQCLDISDNDAVIEEKFGYGQKFSDAGDRLIVVWEAHTEYYTYQIWHIINNKEIQPTFGEITFPDYHFPLCPLGEQITSLDIVVTIHPEYSADEIQKLIPGQFLYGGHICHENISVITSFVEDANQRERYLIYSQAAPPLTQNLNQLIDGITTLENYTHLILRPLRSFSEAIDEIHEFERHHLIKKGRISEQLPASTATALDEWMTELTADYVEVSRLAEAMRYQLSAAVPYESILKVTIQSIQEQPMPPYRPISEYVVGRITGIADGYKQLMRRIDAMNSAIEGTISIIRARIELLLARQNITLLVSMDQTTKRQAILQRTVESLSFIIISYYVTSLANYIFSAFQNIGWIRDAALATGLFVPVALIFSLGLTLLGRNAMNKALYPKQNTKD